MTRRQLRWLLASVVARLPSSALRLAMYRAVLGYRFGAGTRIGFGVTIAVDSFECADHVTIRRGTSFLGPIAVRLAAHTFIGRFNKIECGEGAAQASVRHMNYARRFETGEDSLVNEGHHFDVLGRVAIGRGTWIAGFGSQFLTHGASAVAKVERANAVNSPGSIVAPATAAHAASIANSAGKMRRIRAA